MNAIDISEEGVLKQLETLDTNKSTGPDDLSPHLLKMLSSTISPTLTGSIKIKNKE